MATDGAKRRFGVGKEEVTQSLVELDLARGDLTTAFADLERGRARAFVDMLGQQRLAAGRQDARMTAIRELSDSIRRQRAINAAPGMSSETGVERVSVLLKERDQLLERLRDEDPELADAVSIAEPDLKAVQRRLGAADRLLYSLPVRSSGNRFDSSTFDGTASVCIKQILRQMNLNRPCNHSTPTNRCVRLPPSADQLPD